MTSTRRPAASQTVVLVVAGVVACAVILVAVLVYSLRDDGEGPAPDAAPKAFPPATALPSGGTAERHSLVLPGSGPAVGRLLPAGTRAVVARGATAWLVELADRSRVATFAGHKSPITSMALSADGKTLLTGGRDGAARIWDAETGKRRFQLLFRGAVRSVALANDGRAALVAEEKTETREGKTVGKNAVHLYDAKTGKAMNHLDFKPALNVAVSNDSELALASGDDDPLMAWPLSIRPNPGQGTRPAVPGRCVLASAGGRGALLGASNGQLLFWDAEDMKLVRNFAGHGSAVRDVTGFRTSGAFYSVSGGPGESADNSLRAWHSDRSEPTGRVALSSPGATVSVSASGKLVMTTEENGAVRVFAADAVK